MGVQYILVNLDKQEKIAFYGLDCGTKHSEILANPIATAIISHYLLINSGDKIAFIDDTYEHFELFNYVYSSDVFIDFEDKTQVIVDELVDKHIFQDKGNHLIDADENLFVRDIVLL